LAQRLDVTEQGSASYHVPIAVHIVFNGDTAQPEIRISARPADLYRLGEEIASASQTFVVNVEPYVSEFYPVNLDACRGTGR